MNNLPIKIATLKEIKSFRKLYSSQSMILVKKNFVQIVLKIGKILIRKESHCLIFKKVAKDKEDRLSRKKNLESIH